MHIKDKTLLYLASLLFLIANVYFIHKENFYFSLLPLLLLIIFIAFLNIDKTLLTIVFLTPLSISLREFFPQLFFDMYVPTEPLIVGVMFIFILKLILQKNINKQIFLHPISLAIYLNLFWLFITIFTSTMPIVSLKYLLVRIWFISTFYFVAIQLFKNPVYIYKYIWLYTISLIIVIFYTLIRHSEYGLFYQKAANFVCSPFYNDHTSYGAALAFILPVLIGFLINRKHTLIKTITITLTIIIITTGLIFSYTRAAWLSLAIAFISFIIIKSKIKFRNILISLIILLAFSFSFKTQILTSLKSNKQDSSSNITEQIQSMTNIASDASNLERINRWSSALKMFKEKPFFGFGPGTYMFQYAPYQMSYDKTIISTNFGDGGNAHSEYIGALVESGVLGSITFIIILITTLYTAINLYSRLKNKELRILILSLTLGLISYYVHAFLNNFLDTDKISALFWGYTAIIVSIDIKNKLELQNDKIRKV